MSVRQLDYPKAKLLMEITSQPEEQWRISAASKEPWTVAFIEKAEDGSRFLDIGANVGAYTLIAVANGMQTIAIEPHFANYARLCQNLALNNMMDKVICIPAAVGPSSGFDWLHIQDMRTGSAHHVIGGTLRQFFHRQLIWIWSLDNIMTMVGWPGPLYIKIDVDGGELGVLQGALETLHNPNLKGIMLEMALDLEVGITEFLKGVGWTLKERIDQRGESTIQGVCYGEFVRGS